MQPEPSRRVVRLYRQDCSEAAAKTSTRHRALYRKTWRHPRNRKYTQHIATPRKSRTELRPRETRYLVKIWWSLGVCSWDIGVRTDRQTDSHAHCNTPLPYWGGVTADIVWFQIADCEVKPWQTSHESLMKLPCQSIMTCRPLDIIYSFKACGSALQSTCAQPYLSTRPIRPVHAGSLQCSLFIADLILIYILFHTSLLQPVRFSVCPASGCPCVRFMCCIIALYHEKPSISHCQCITVTDWLIS